MFSLFIVLTLIFNKKIQSSHTLLNVVKAVSAPSILVNVSKIIVNICN